MAGQYLTRSEMGDLKYELGKTNSMRKRAGLEQHPTYAVICGCPDRRCGGLHSIDTRRVIPTAEEADDILRRHSQIRKKEKRVKSVVVE